LKNEGVIFKILIAGEGELRSYFEKIIKEENLMDEVKLLGHVQDIPAFLNSLDVFAFTSLYEGSANTLIETLQYGIPTVAWNISSNPEIITSGETGFLAKLGDIHEFKEMIKTCIQDQHLRHKFIQKGQEKINETFDKNKNLKILYDLINN